MGRDHERERRRSRSRSRSPSGHRRHKERSSKKYSERKTYSSRHRSDSRSPSRHRSSRRSPSPSTTHRRHRDRSRSPSSKHNSHRVAEGPAPINRERVEDIIGGMSYKNFDIDEQQKQLELIMQERRERVEKWRSQHKVETGEDGKADQIETAENDTCETENIKKKWTLDDENEDDDEDIDEITADNEQDQFGDGLDKDENDTMLPIPLRDKHKEDDEEDKIEKVVQSEHHDKEPDLKNETVNTKEHATSEIQMKKNQSEQTVQNNDKVEDDEDPLDAYMKGIQEEVKKYRSTTVKSNKDKVTVVVVGVAKKKSEDRKRGELIEQNQDAMEYSSDDETDGKNLDDIMSGGADGPKVKQKKLMTISKDDITYIPFRKAFYIEVPEIAKMTPEEVEIYKTEMEGIKTKGKGCPRPIKTWAQCGVSKKVLEVLKK